MPITAKRQAPTGISDTANDNEKKGRLKACYFRA